MDTIPLSFVASMCYHSCSLLVRKDFVVPRRRLGICKPINSTQLKSTVSEPLVRRRTANYESSLWSYDQGKHYAARADHLKKVVKMMIQKSSNVENPLTSKELVDHLQRLGISYHFKEEISDALEMIYYQTHIFGNFKDKIENLNLCRYEDMVGILNLYEASYHSFENECILDEARDLTTIYLKEKLDEINESIAPLVRHALEVPLQSRVPRVEARWFIEVYEKRSDMNPTLIELAKLDFNMVQIVHIEDLKHASSYVPGFSTRRRDITKVNAMITTIDDVYDVYGTLDELERFSDVISRWDINAIEELPDYMKTCFLGLYNTINDITYNTLINTEILVLPYLTKVWADLCKSYLVEARWYHSGHTPTLEDYLNNACITIGSPLTFMHIKCSTSITSTQEILQWLEETKTVVNHTALIVRLADDLATSSDEMERGDIPKSIQCYMYESGATEDEARRYIKSLIMKTWKKLNKERASAKSQLLREYIDYAMDIVRIAQFMYGKGDGHGRPNVTKSHVLSLLFNPIQGI
ncbi:hypothetical protein L1987_81678 [Smallanthus sonchifolius]|uniref:Uncharacterized protein n=1 Tax=Smallanthus sonchifolius TaxID=185202 RepID=A0ACB8YRR5_9ASTR|nr:hypothetical protein L1987_81678 [Smallanthus sonchifolius]